MKFLSLCSGIEAASIASSDLLWKAVAFSEISDFPAAVLKYRFPDIANLGDMTKFRSWDKTIFSEADAIVGGPPCQAFSMAGKRTGLDDERGNLTITYANLIDYADEIRKEKRRKPVWCLYENVPGILADKTNAFGCLLGKLAGEDVPLVPSGKRWSNAGLIIGHKRTIAWRTLDAKHFGMAQRRRRVFVVATARKDMNPAEILFEFEGTRRDNPPVSGTLMGDGRRTETSLGNKSEDLTYILQGSMIGRSEKNGPQGSGVNKGVCFTLNCTDRHAVATEEGTRLLTPLEHERLQGFPDNWTLIPFKGKKAKDCPDGLRYKAIGNSWAVNCVKWIFQRIDTMTHK